MQQRLSENAARGRGSLNRSIASPLAGKLFDADGQPLYVQRAAKGRRRYRYYVSKFLGFFSQRRKAEEFAQSRAQFALSGSHHVRKRRVTRRFSAISRL